MHTHKLVFKTSVSDGTPLKFIANKIGSLETLYETLAAGSIMSFYTSIDKPDKPTQPWAADIRPQTQALVNKHLRRS